MTTPFAPFGNCILVFQLSVSPPVPDEGDPEFDPLSPSGNTQSYTEELSVRVMLSESSRPREINFPGAENTDEFLEGRVISLLDSESEPTGITALPMAIYPGVQAAANFDSGVTGDFFLEPFLPSPYYDEVGILGQPLRGRFVRRIVFSEVVQ